jgi:hypothetical protein
MRPRSGPSRDGVWPDRDQLGHYQADCRRVRSSRAHALYRHRWVMNENFSLIVMCIFLLGSLAFLAQQLTSYH